MYLNTPTLDDKRNLAIASPTPKINLLLDEIEQSLTDVSSYYSRCQQADDYWFSRWDGQTTDGLKHRRGDDEDVFPWENASDTRVRLAEKFVNQHNAVAKTAFMKARVSATAVLPAVNGREASQGTQLLKWMIYSHMQGDLQLEVPLAFTWRHAYGASFLRVGWKQEERIDQYELNLPILDQFIQAAGGPPDTMLHLMDMLYDPKHEDTLVAMVQQLSPLVTLRLARQIVTKLQEEKVAQVPVPYTFVSRPSWTARRLGYDILVPASTRDPQDGRWIIEREWVDEPELRGREFTMDYDPAFITELLKHRGQTDDATWNARRCLRYDTYGQGQYYRMGGSSEFANQFELFHAYYRTSDQGRPCLYETTFAPALCGNKRSDNPLYAKHEPLGYDHGQKPFVALRYERKQPEIASSRGIPEIVYTWEREIKTQRDGRTDATALVHRPPMIVPFSRQQAIKNTPIPGAVFGVTRPGEVSWMPAPAQSNLPIEIERMILDTAEEFIGLFANPEVDRGWINLRREEFVGEVLGEMILVGDQTFMLLQQFEPDEEVQAVVGTLKRPFHLDKHTIQQKHTISFAFDAGTLDPDGREQKLERVLKAVSLDTSGRWDMSVISEIAVELIDPSFVDRALRPMGVVTEQETKDELAAVAAAVSGIELPLPQHGNFQLRLQTLVQAVQSNPQIQQELQGKPLSMEIVKKRFQYYTNQIQQRGMGPGGGNPQIGRTLATSALNPQTALPTVAEQGN